LNIKLANSILLTLKLQAGPGLMYMSKQCSLGRPTNIDSISPVSAEDALNLSGKILKKM
jgi:hypothetical protein